MSKVYVYRDFRVALPPGQFVNAYPEGGGFHHRIPLEEFLDKFREVDPTQDKYVLCRVGFDDPDNVVSFEAYVGPRRWNGWVIPYFTRLQAEALLAAVKVLGWPVKATRTDTGYSLLYEGDDEPRQADFVTVPGVNEPVVHLFDGWCWDIIEEEEK